MIDKCVRKKQFGSIVTFASPVLDWTRCTCWLGRDEQAHERDEVQLVHARHAGVLDGRSLLGHRVVDVVRRLLLGIRCSGQLLCGQTPGPPLLRSHLPKERVVHVALLCGSRAPARVAVLFGRCQTSRVVSGMARSPRRNSAPDVDVYHGGRWHLSRPNLRLVPDVDVERDMGSRAGGGGDVSCASFKTVGFMSRILWLTGVWHCPFFYSTFLCRSPVKCHQTSGLPSRSKG